ncbi:MAG: hypothetical protein IPN95_04200 [Bacteroidetes bacterium]|nr:hypothetical protein [Bacteroidota bacterium]
MLVLRRRSCAFAVACLLITSCLLPSCASLKELSLYDNQGVPLPGIKGFTMTDLYHDGVSSEMWGVEDVACKLVEKTEKTAFQGTSSLHLKWDRTAAGCPWIGFGIGWANWLGKDLGGIMDTAAIQFYARVDTGTINYIPIVFLLEGYDGKQTASVMNPLGIEGGKIGQNWTKVRIPLSSFDYRKSGIELSNIKQLLMQFEGIADVYIDEMTIVPFKSEFGREETNLTVVHDACPRSLFSDALPHAWGINPLYCRNFTMDSTQFKAGFASVRVEVAPQKNGCTWNEMGFNWNNWLYNDISLLKATAALQLYVKPANGNQMPVVKLGFEDYSNHTAWVELSEIYSANATFGPDWTQVLIPLRQFPFLENKVELTEIKALKIAVEGESAFNIDEISLVEFRGNPKNPFGK